MNRREFHLGLLATGFCLLDGRATAANRGSWKVVQELRHNSPMNVEHIEVSSDHQVLASWAVDGSLCAWNLPKKSQILSRSERCSLGGFERKALVFNEGEEVKRLWLPSGEQTVVHASLQPSAISPGGEWWVGMRGPSAPTLWNLGTGKVVPLSAPPATYKTENRFFHFSEDAKWVVIAQGVRALLWRIDKPDDPMTLPDQPNEITTVRLTRNADLVLMGCLGGTLTVHNRANPRQNQQANIAGEVRGLGLDNAGHRVLIGRSDSPTPACVQELPWSRRRSPLAAEPQRWNVQEETWACWMSGNLAATGHPGGLIRVWKWSPA